MGVACSRGGAEPEDLPLQLQAERVLAASRSRGLAPPPERGQPALVRLSVYDAQECPRHPFVLSGPSGEEERLHCGVEVHSCEWSYGGEQRQWGFDWHLGPAAHPTGITCYVPRESPGHAFSESVLLGRTLLGEEDVLRVVQALGRAWAAADHHPLTRSCLHFSDALCQLLGVGRVPDRVRRLAAELAGGLGCSLGCCSTGLCSSRAAGPGTGQELFVVRRQLEQATLQLQQAQRDLACERASHEDAIRQVLQLKRAGSRCPARVPGPLSAKP